MMSRLRNRFHLRHAKVHQIEFTANPGRYVLRTFLEACAIFVLLDAAVLIRLINLPAGKHYVLSPTGLGILYDALTKILGVSFFLVLYTLPSLVVRKWLGCILRALMFLIFVVFLTSMECSRYIVAVQTPDQFIFLRCFPFSSTSIPNYRLPVPKIRDTGAVRALKLGQNMEFEPVWHGDRSANESLDRLFTAIQNARIGKF